MKSNTKLVSLILALIFSLSAVAFGQETTGDLGGTIKDEQGNVVPGITVNIRNKTGVGVKRVIVSDDEGKFVANDLPPGIYSISTEAAKGFGSVTVENVEVLVGKSLDVPVSLKAGGVSATIDITATDNVTIDTTGSQIQSNITSQQIENLPNGVSFGSLLRLSPSTRQESKSGGFQVDGASGSENSFIIDGQDVSNFKSNNLNGVNNIPTNIVEQVTVKSSGFDAEFGGATGGVVSVVTKGGGNEYRGQFGIEFDTPELNAGPRPALARVQDTTTAQGNIAEYLKYGRNGGVDYFPTAQFSGPIIKDKLYGLVNYSRQIFTTNQTSIYTTNAPISRRVETGREDYLAKQIFEYASARVDANPFSTLRLTGTFLWNPQINDGNIPDNPLNLGGSAPSTSLNGVTYRGYQFSRLQGGRVNSNNVTAQGVWTPSSQLVVSGRYSRGFLNEKPASYFVPNATQYICSALSGSIGTFTSAQSGCAQGFSNFPANRLTNKEVSIKTNYEGDVTFITSGFLGSHQLKSGYQYSKIFTDIDSNSNVFTGTINLYYGRPITQGTGPVVGLSASPTAIGYGRISRFGQVASGSNRNQGFYIQDKWQPISRLTLNLGVRFEEEYIPTFNGVPIQVAYGWGDKIAPRIGGAFDVFGNGKTKIFGSYGKFYDRLKFELPAGSFGGDYFRRDFFEIFPGETYNSFTLANVLGSFVGPSGGDCPISPSGSRVRCHLDLRVPSLAVKDLKPFTQREITVGFEHEMFKNYLFTARYTNKTVLDAVEDIGYFNEFGSEVYNIGNPCKGEIIDLYKISGFKNCVEAERKYNAVQLTLERRFANNFFFNANYTYSRLFGNYSGLASSDENGRDDPGVTRYFDIPIQGFAVATGKPDNGLLATDRPHVFNFYGAYAYNWFGSKTNETNFSLFTTAQSGAPITTTVEFLANEVILNGRGDLGRTPVFTRSDFGVSHKYRFGRDNKYSLVMNVTINNVFNENNVTDYFRLITDTGIDISPEDIGFADTLDAINAAITTGVGSKINTFLNSDVTLKDPRYGKPSAFQAPRNIRFGFSFQF